MDPSRPSQNPKSTARRRPLFRIEAEALEGRQLLTGGAGNTFALTRGTIGAPGGATTADFTVAASHFSSPTGRATIGVDVVAGDGSSVTPMISKIGGKGPHAQITAISPDGPHAVFASVSVPRKGHQVTSVVTIKAQDKTQGDFLLGYYLPGDADGDGKVTKVDLATIKAQIGKTVNDSTYNFDADSNRDGQITKADLTLARQNLGVSTTILPDFTANLDPSTDSGAADRITNDSTVKFTGVAAPDAAITFHEVKGLTPDVKTTADASGNYSISIPLAAGTNTFQVTSVDSFGQTIQGSIQPVTYTTGSVPQTTAAASTTSTSATVQYGFQGPTAGFQIPKNRF